MHVVDHQGEPLAGTRSCEQLDHRLEQHVLAVGWRFLVDVELGEEAREM